MNNKTDSNNDSTTIDMRNTLPFSSSIFNIHNEYKYTPKPFEIEYIRSEGKGTEGSAKILAYAQINNLNTEQTLFLFGEHYQNVLDTPNGDNHKNIRALIKYGIAKVTFPEGYPIEKRNKSLESVITETWENRSNINREDDYLGRNEVFEVFELIEEGLLGPVAVNPDVLSYADSREEAENGIIVYPWVKEALLLGLSKQFKMRWIDKTSGYRDFLPVFPMTWDEFEKLEKCELNSRQAPPGARRGSRFMGVQSMPNTWINSGAVVGEGTMLDNLSVAASCSYIGKNCHISGKAGIGGVFEPLGAIPNVVGDNVFIGVGSEPTEGCIIGSGAVLAPKVVITSGTRIYDMRKKSKKYGEYSFGFIPHDVLVTEGTYSIENNISAGCVLIRKNIDPDKRGKVDTNAMLREM